LDVLADPEETTETRAEAAGALHELGAHPEAARGIPVLVKLLKDRGTDSVVRFRVAFALFVHAEKLRKMPEALAAYAQVLAEPREPEHQAGKLLRYHCAGHLAFLQGHEAPAGVLDVLLDNLEDKTIRVSKGREDGKDKIGGDGRIIAIRGLT